MSNILVRSPRYFSNTDAVALSLKLSISIDSVERYVIIKNYDTNDNVLIEYAELVRDYIDIKENNVSSLNTVVSLNYKTYSGLNATGTQLSNVTEADTFAINGYGYFEEGYNPTVDRGYMQSNDIIYTQFGEDFRIPVDRNHTTSVEYYYKGEETFNETITTSATDVFKYTDANDSFEERVTEDSGVYESNCCITKFIDNNKLYLVDKVIVNSFSDNLVSNGNFADASGWSIEGTDTISGGALNISGTGTRTPTSFVPIVGRKYKVTFDISSYTSGNISAYDGANGTNLSGNLNATGTYTYTYIQPLNTTNNFNFFVSTAFVGSIDNVSIIELSAREIKVNTLNEKKYTPIKLKFINRYGAEQEFWFVKKSIEKVKTKRENYNRFNIGSNGSYGLTEHQNQVFNVQSNKSLKLNTGYIDESQNVVMQEILQSEYVWVEIDGTTYPVNVDTDSYTFKTSVNDMLVDYSIDVSYSFSAINNIR